MSFHGDHIAIADLAGEVLILDGQNKLAATLGDNPDPKQRAKFDVPPEAVEGRHLQRPARHLLRQGRQPLRRRLERVGADQQDDEGEGSEAARAE